MTGITTRAVTADGGSRRRWLVFAGLAFLWGLVAATAAEAATASPSSGVRAVVVNSNAPVFWQGQVRKDGPTTPAIPQCQAVNCDHTRLRVRLPFWQRLRPGGVQVAIRFPTGVFGDSLALHVYRGSRLVASSAGQVGTAQSVELPKFDADYDVYVAYNPFIPEIAADVLDYEGLAENENRQPVLPLRSLLPDLKVLPQTLVTFATPPPIFGDSAPEGSSCFMSEIEEQGASVCLRLAQSAANIGSGAVDVRWSVDADTPEPEEPATQRVYRSDGSFRERAAGFMHFHPIHGHYHFEGFSQSHLYQIGPDGGPAGPPVASGTKNGFCMADTGMYWWGLKGDAAQAYPAPRCLDPQEVVDGRAYFMNGISRGWSDEYGWDLPDQMVEVSGVPDGDYVLTTRLDTSDKLLEEREDNNCVMIKVRLTNMESADRAASLVGSPLPCT